MKKKYKQDELLLEKIKRNDQAAMKSLHQDLWPSFYAFISKGNHLNSRDALDIYNKSFTTLWWKIKTGDFKAPLTGSIKTYLFNIGTYKLQGFKKIIYDKRVILVDDFKILEEKKSDNSIDQNHEQEAQKALVKRLLNKLDPPCRKLIWLSFIKEFSADAIASEMNIPSEGAVRQRQFACMKKLRKLLKNSKSDS